MLKNHINEPFRPQYWQNQYKIHLQKARKHKITKGHQSSKYQNLYTSKANNKYKCSDSYMSFSSQSSIDSLDSYKNNKYCCSKKRKLIKQSNLIQCQKNKKKLINQQNYTKVNHQHQCGYKLQQCPLIQHYLKKISKKLKANEQKQKTLLIKNKQLVRENKFFNQYYQTFEQKLKQNENLKKSKIIIQHSRSLKPEKTDFQSADYGTFRKLAINHKKQDIKSLEDEDFEEQNHLKNEQYSQITKSSYHKNQILNLNKKQHQNSLYKKNYEKNLKYDKKKR